MKRWTMALALLAASAPLGAAAAKPEKPGSAVTAAIPVAPAPEPAGPLTLEEALARPDEQPAPGGGAGGRGRGAGGEARHKGAGAAERAGIGATGGFQIRGPGPRER